MTFRDLALRAALATGVVATIATSPPPNFELTADATIDVAVPEAHRLRLRANQAAIAGTDELDLEISFVDPDQPFTIVPDDSDFEIVEGFGSQVIDLSPMCPTDQACELFFTIDAGENTGIGDGTEQLSAFASFLRFGDPSFFFPDDRDFPDDATLEVIFGDQ